MRAAGLNRLAGLGQLIHDLPAGLYRWRQMLPVAVSLDQLGPEIFSEDGSQLIYTGSRDSKTLIYVNGAPLPNTYTAWVRESRPVFTSATSVDLFQAGDIARSDVFPVLKTGVLEGTLVQGGERR